MVLLGVTLEPAKVQRQQIEERRAQFGDLKQNFNKEKTTNRKMQAQYRVHQKG